MKSILFLSLCAIIIGCNHQREPGNTSSITDSIYGEKTACLLSQIAYSRTVGEDINRFMPEWKITWDGIPVGGNYAFIVTNGEGYAIAIRGSLLEFSWDAFQNWVYQDLHVTSLKKWPHTTDSSKAKIAQGTWDGWQNLCNMKDKKTGKTMLTFLETNLTEKTPVLITGHSLGGNLGTVYASYLWQYLQSKGKGNTNINVITFASPAAGNREFAADFDNKFPNALRYENKHDLVPKFPCTPLVESLGELYDSIPSASTIMVGYQSRTVSLSKVFSFINMGLHVLAFTNSNADYTQPGATKFFTIPLSGKNKTNDIQSWLSEAGYQHGMEQYAKQLGVPVVGGDQSQ